MKVLLYFVLPGCCNVIFENTSYVVDTGWTHLKMIKLRNMRQNFKKETNVLKI